MTSQYFFGFILSFIAGVLFESISNFGYSFALLFLALALVLVLLGGVISSRRRSFFVSFVLAGCALGVLRVDVSSYMQNAHALDALVETSTRATGMVIEQPVKNTPTLSLKRMMSFMIQITMSLSVPCVFWYAHQRTLNFTMVMKLLLQERLWFPKIF